MVFNKMKQYKTQSIYWGLITLAVFIGVMTTSVLGDLLLKEMEISNIIKVEKQYKYNEQVPVEVVKEEIRKQANLFEVDADKALRLADCESGFNNLAVNNQGSTATGIYMFVIRTWMVTDSWQEHRIARTEFRANIREAMIKLSNKEYSHWLYCGKQAGFKN